MKKRPDEKSVSLEELLSESLRVLNRHDVRVLDESSIDVSTVVDDFVGSERVREAVARALDALTEELDVDESLARHLGRCGIAASSDDLREARDLTAERMMEIESAFRSRARELVETFVRDVAELELEAFSSSCID